ncbi:MAG TPA: efflux RND transporter periplasmic adaptor subunit [Candidatus Deferrimicrobium sp.]|nr:efflux RND transporter periplasmic adaptor subunit [Candidatus Deferrimicrobium sp.]
MKLSKWHFIGLAGLAVLVASLYIYSSLRSEEPERRAMRFKEFIVQRGAFVSVVSASGVVVPIDRVEIKSKASGLIEELPVEQGDIVAKGALICRLDQTTVKAEVEQAHADLDIAQAELRQAENLNSRRQQLFAGGLISQEELDQTELSLAQAKGKLIRVRTVLDQANTRLSETVVTSPIDGVILQKFVEVGQIISSGISNVGGGTAIADIADMTFVHVEAGVDEIDVGKVRIKQPARVVAEAFPEMTFSGEIIRIAPEAKVEQNVTLFDVVVQVENTQGLLKSGMNATVEITIARDEDVLLVPTVALSEPRGRDANRKARQVSLKQGESFVPHEVEIGSSDEQQTVVVRGLQEGDTLGVPMQSRLQEENNRMEERMRSTRSFGNFGTR